jgi:hypothetical protein
MEKKSGLADLKLVNKYYPSVANYSYPRHDAMKIHRCEGAFTGRSSVGSECSVPGMVDDQESDISAEDANQSHIAGDETFDSFWEDSEAFWGVEPGEKSNTVLIGPMTQSTALQQGGRTPSHGSRHHTPQRSMQDVKSDPDPCWPLVSAAPPAAPTPKPSKATYSLFPPPPPAPQQGLALLRRPGGGPTSLGTRSEVPWDMQKQLASAVSLPLPNRRKKPRKLHLPASDGAIRYDSISSTQSAPGTPTTTFLMASPTAVNFSRRSQQTLPSQVNPSLSRAHSDVKTVQCPSGSAGHSPQRPTTQFAMPTQPHDVPRGRRGHQRTPSQLRQSISASDVSSTPRITPSPVDSYSTVQPRTPSGSSRPVTPLKQQVVMPVSVFESDSDSDSEGDSAANFARRIVKNLTPHKHLRSRSASAAPRSRKGSDIAEKQLRRARADTVTSPVEGQPMSGAECLGAEDKENESPSKPALRRQKSEVFGTLFGRRR